MALVAGPIKKNFFAASLSLDAFITLLKLGYFLFIYSSLFFSGYTLNQSFTTGLSLCNLSNLAGGLKPRKAICELSINRGGCQARLRRFYFDATDESCKLFVFGGCQGEVTIYFSLVNFLMPILLDSLVSFWGF